MAINLNHNAGPNWLQSDGTEPVAEAPKLSEIVNGYIDIGLRRRKAEKDEREPRNYLGMSEIGDPCMRKVYLHQVGAPSAELAGPKLRIFELGHILEALIIDWMRSAGFTVRDRNKAGQQFGVSTANGRIQAHIDGAVIGGPPLPSIVFPALLEIKGLGNKWWNPLVKKGCRKAEPKYFAQVQQYMGYLGLSCTLFCAMNKDNQLLYWEAIPYEVKEAQRYSDRGVEIIKAVDRHILPPRISVHSDYFVCRMCDLAETCWAMPT